MSEMQHKVCPRCSKRFETTEEIRFCSDCGAPLHADGTSGPTRVLLGEDAIIARRKVGAVLKKLGCEVIEATDGKEAVEMARSQSPDLIILDVHMPFMNGLQVLQTLRGDESLKGTPIIMLTTEADAKFVREAFTKGAQDYLRKDTLATELQERLNVHIQQIRSQR